MAAVLDVGDEVLTAEDDNHGGEEWRRVEGRWKKTVALVCSGSARPQSWGR